MATASTTIIITTKLNHYYTVISLWHADGLSVSAKTGLAFLLHGAEDYKAKTNAIVKLMQKAWQATFHPLIKTDEIITIPGPAGGKSIAIRFITPSKLDEGSRSRISRSRRPSVIDATSTPGDSEVKQPQSNTGTDGKTIQLVHFEPTEEARKKLAAVAGFLGDKFDDVHKARILRDSTKVTVDAKISCGIYISIFVISHHEN